MRIGIYGGSFNPPHMAHLIVAESVRDQFGLDQILWMPGYIPPHKTHLTLADANHRLEMTRLAIRGNPRFTASNLEIERKGTSFTIDTVKHLLKTHPEHTYYLVIGEDSLHDFTTWRDPEGIVERVELLVYRRPSVSANPEQAPITARYPGRIHFAEAPLLEVSSAGIRERIAAGKTIRHLVPDAVYDYIAHHKLYDVQDETQGKQK